MYLIKITSIYILLVSMISACNQKPQNQSCKNLSPKNKTKNQIQKTSKKVMGKPEQLAQGQVDAYNARNIDKFVSFYAKDVKIYYFPSNKLIMDGRETMTEKYRAYFQKSPNLHCKIVSRIVDDNFVIDHEEVTGGRGKGKVSATAIYEVKNDLIQNVWFIKK
jgi:hypothetical protein